jgi:serine/threonine protein kinase
METNEGDLLDIAERMRIGLTTYSTGGDWDAKEYTESRKTLLGSPVADLLPSFVKHCRTLPDFWSFIKGKFVHYQERREFLRTEFAPLLDRLEQGSESISELDEYELGELIGRGGFGRVHRAHHRLLEIDFAVKLFSPFFTSEGDKALDRFFREARILFRLNHPNIIRVFHVGLLKGQPYIRMELFDGKTLNDTLKEKGRIPARRARAIAKEVARGLAHAHKEKILHRDLKPSNVMTTKPGRLKILDFGLGAFIEDDIVSRVTRTGESIVSGYYTAPELLQDPQLLDPRVDIYSLGAIWFTLLTGRAPAGVGIADTLRSECGQLPEAECKVILDCLSPIEKRTASANDLIEAIDAIE